ncbi:MAG TPA: hypothetical protein VII94_04855 [Candidatus Saccharimonadales bacterium]
MSTFSEANQVRLSLKMKFSQYAWYKSSAVANVKDGFGIVIVSSKLDNKIRKIVPPLIDGISVKIEVDSK